MDICPHSGERRSGGFEAERIAGGIRYACGCVWPYDDLDGHIQRSLNCVALVAGRDARRKLNGLVFMNGPAIAPRKEVRRAAR